MVFKKYARYYDLLNKDKNYFTETEYVLALIKKYSVNKTHNILDIGCGTGKHANLIASKGYKVTGIDRSADMINIANTNKSEGSEFFIGDAVNFDLQKKFDVIISLFHVVSYQITNRDIYNTLSMVSKHLVKGGLFIFDFWYGPAVLTERPQVRIKRLEDDALQITRIAEPVMYPNKNIVAVNYEILITEKDTKMVEKISEIHNMRYFFLPELELFLQKNKLSILKNEEWLTGSMPSFQTWGVCCITKKNL